MDADLARVRPHDLAAAPRIARRRQLQREEKTVRIAAAANKAFGFRRVVG